ncbi:MAG: hypothetical protein ABIH76_00810 [Candidatus Bathyarchaeota archaeon]
MAAPKGNTYSSGRPPGAKNVKTQQWEAIGEFLTTQGAERLVTYLNTCEEKDYADTYLKILEYFKPKLARRELTGPGGETLTINTIAYGDHSTLQLPAKTVPTTSTSGD